MICRLHVTLECGVRGDLGLSHMLCLFRPSQLTDPSWANNVSKSALNASFDDLKNSKMWPHLMWVARIHSRNARDINILDQVAFPRIFQIWKSGKDIITR